MSIYVPVIHYKQNIDTVTFNIPSQPRTQFVTNVLAKDNLMLHRYEEFRHYCSTMNVDIIK